VKWRTGRSIGFAVVADATSRPSYVRLAAWIALVASFAGIGYATRFSHARGSVHVSVYSFSTFAGGMVQYAVILGIVLLICIHRFDLLALRRPANWRRSLVLAAGVIVAILAWEALVNLIPLPQSPGNEQGITNVHWESAHAAAFAANVFLFAIFGPFVEELTFRGCGQSLLQFLGRTASILLVGVAFGVWHGLVEALLVLIPFGIALAWLRDRTDSVLPGFFVHALFNAAALALIFS
jgi:membrane protease YdiL (CAAX protease family)